MIEINVATLKSIAEVVALAILFYGYFAKVVRFADKQKHMDEELKVVNEELGILTYGVLACLKGLKEKGCDGPVSDAIQRIEKHLNQEAHKYEVK